MDEANRLQEEEKLVTQAKQNPAAFGRLYDLHYTAIFNYILRRTASVEMAQDITSETFFKALQNIGKFEWRNVSFLAWLYKIAGNEIAAYFRKGTYKAESLDRLQEEEGFEVAAPDDLEEELISAEEVLEQHQDFLLCRTKIEQLPLKYQEVIALRFFAGKKLKEIGEILSKSEGTVKSLLHRGLKKLKKLMSEDSESATFSATHHYKGRG